MGSDFRINLYRKEPKIDLHGVIEPKLAAKADENYIVRENGSYTVGTDGTEVGTNGTETGTDGTEVGTNGTETVIATDGIMTDEEKLVSVIREDGAVTQKQMSQKTGLSLRKIKRMTVELQKSGKIIRVGNSRSGKWQV